MTTIDQNAVAAAQATGLGDDPRVAPPCRDCTEAQREAFVGQVGRLVHEHRAYLLRVARREGLGAEDAFDVVQDAFQQFLVLPAARQLAGEATDARKLLSVLTRNLARNRRRRAFAARPHETSDEVLASLPAELPNVDELLASAEDAVRLHGCLRSLGEVQRAVVTLRMLHGIDGHSVARSLGLGAGHVAVLLHRAKSGLLACMTRPDAPAPAHDDSRP
jgi:RNA polymerase sigma-70 factor (ECF subfamily)